MTHEQETASNASEAELHNLCMHGKTVKMKKAALAERSFRHVRNMRAGAYPLVTNLRIGDRVQCGKVAGFVLGANDSANFDIRLEGQEHASNIHPGDITEVSAA